MAIEPKKKESEVFGPKKWADTIALQIMSAAFEISKSGGSVSPEEISKMTVRELLEVITPNKLRLKLEKV